MTDSDRQTLDDFEEVHVIEEGMKCCELFLHGGARHSVLAGTGCPSSSSSERAEDWACESQEGEQGLVDDSIHCFTGHAGENVGEQ